MKKLLLIGVLLLCAAGCLPVPAPDDTYTIYLVNNVGDVLFEKEVSGIVYFQDHYVCWKDPVTGLYTEFVSKSENTSVVVLKRGSGE